MTPTARRDRGCKQRQSVVARAASSYLFALSLLIAHASACSNDPADGRAPPACPSADIDGVTKPLRRLSGFELRRTLAELSGAAPELFHAAPPDEPGLGFDNNAGTYSVSESHAERYFALAEAAATALLDNPELVAEYAGCESLAEPGCRRQFLVRFGLLAFRRPLSEVELAAFESVADESVDSTLAASAAVTTMLQSPQFLYRLEPKASSSSQRPKTYALASRLSYLLVSAPPDSQLLAAADTGKLEENDVLDSHVDRLLADVRSSEMFRHFVRQWWELDQLPKLEKDRSLYRTWSETVRDALDQEARLFIDDVWTGQPTLRQLLTSVHTFINPTLAGFYGVSPPSGEGFSRVQLSAERAAGLFTLGAFLASHARPDQTSPVLRGKFVRDRLLCAPPPPPPPNIAVNPPLVDPRLSTRARFEQHTADPTCAGCHLLMDPIGFGFEAFDATGVYREVDGGVAIDATGELVDTDVDGGFVGVRELAQRLVESHQVHHCVASQWFHFAFGRGTETEQDACTVDALTHALETSGGDFHAMVRATVRSRTFRGQTSKGDTL